MSALNVAASYVDDHGEEPGSPAARLGSPARPTALAPIADSDNAVMTLPFDPACLPMLLGGLPHRSPAQALEATRRYTSQLLAWPQLPQRSFREQSVVQSAIGFPGLVIDAARMQVYVDRKVAERGLDRLGLAYLEADIEYAALGLDDAAGLDELLRQAANIKGILALKGQLLGPVSLAAQLTDEQQRPLIYDDVFFDALAQHLRLRAAWQEARLGELAAATIICLEEPFLESVGLPFLPVDWERVLGQIEDVLGGVTGCKALFAAGAINWAHVLESSVGMIVADIAEDATSLIAAAPALPDFLERDGVIGLGVVPSDEEALEHATSERLMQSVESLIEALETAGVARERLLRRAVLSPAGGLSQLSNASAERAIQLVAEVSGLLRTKYELGEAR